MERFSGRPVRVLGIFLALLALGCLGLYIDRRGEEAPPPTAPAPSAEANLNGASQTETDKTEPDAKGEISKPGENTELLSEMKVSEISETGVTVSWTVTEPATGSVSYGPTLDYGSETVEETSFRYASHVQKIVGLKKGTTYHFRIYGMTESGTQFSSQDQTFVTAGEQDDQPPTPNGTNSGELRLGVTSMMSLSDTSIRDWVSVRFKAEHSGAVESVRQYLVTKRPNAPDRWYARGNGGILRISICPDKEGLPEKDACFPGQVEIDFRPHFRDGLYAGPDRRGYINNVLLGLHSFSEPVTLSKGTTYHILYENIDESPAANYVGYDGIGVSPPLPLTNANGPALPNPGRPDNLELLVSPGVSRSPRANGFFDLPIYELRYSNGQVQGQAIMQWEPDQAYIISGSKAVRYTVKLPADKTVSELAVALAYHATGSVSLNIESPDGTVLRSVTAKANGTKSHRSEVWAQGKVDPITLKAGEEYALVIRPQDGYTGRVIANQCGTAYGFDRASCFGYGVAQKSDDGKNWTSWSSNDLFFFGMSIK